MTSMRSPPTCFTISPRIENEATAFTLSAALAPPARPSMISSANPIDVTMRCFMTRDSFRLKSRFMLARQEAPHEAAFGADQDENEIEEAGEQDDCGAGRHVGVIGDQQPCEARRERNEDGDENEPGDVIGPEAG